MVQFLSINFISWISSIFIRFFKSSRFFVSLCIYFFFVCFFVSFYSWQGDTTMATPENSRPLWEKTFHCAGHQTPQLFPIRRISNSPWRIEFYIHFNITLPEKPRSSEISYPFKFPDQHSALIYVVSNVYTFHQFHSLLTLVGFRQKTNSETPCYWIFIWKTFTIKFQSCKVR